MFIKAAALTLLVSAVPLTTSLQHPIVHTDDFRVVRHRDIHGASLRIKRNDGWCDTTPGVASYSGYLDTDEDTHTFFYFFEARTAAQNKPLALWTNGGPGCSSSMGLMMELGPCRIVENGPIDGKQRLKRFNHSWSDHANMIFIDQPCVRRGLMIGKYL